MVEAAVGVAVVGVGPISLWGGMMSSTVTPRVSLEMAGVPSEGALQVAVWVWTLLCTLPVLWLAVPEPLGKWVTGNF